MDWMILLILIGEIVSHVGLQHDCWHDTIKLLCCGDQECRRRLRCQLRSRILFSILNCSWDHISSQLDTKHGLITGGWYTRVWGWYSMHRMGKSYHWWSWTCKAFDIRKHFAHEILQNRHMRLIRVPTDEQLADIFTKALPFPQFERCLMGLMSGDLKPKGPWASVGGEVFDPVLRLG